MGEGRGNRAGGRGAGFVVLVLALELVIDELWRRYDFENDFENENENENERECECGYPIL